MNFSVIIPARLASTRLPNKPLADIGGLPMVVRVAQRAALSQAQQVVVAADDATIVAACERHGVRALLTRTDHASGSDRLAEACMQLGLDGPAAVVNVQGDEPLIEPALIDACAALLHTHPDCAVGTVAHPIASVADYLDPNVVKVVLDAVGHALLFSRAPLPWWRDGPASDAGGVTALPDPPPLRHIGLYAYRAHFLRRFPRLAMAPLERIEALEQLRVLWHGERIAVHVSAQAPGAGVDTPQDLERVRRLFMPDRTR
ncbi:MAG: 3-deoxy-manno-octulosonate cytidylyltransferase [Burkholderiaceae bacterium]|nr:3-deoxy-manno-octulosonate cytidylyltransferase [Burkholderiaceae bacterium]